MPPRPWLRRVSVTTAALLLLSPDVSGQWSFTRVADTTTQAPGGATFGATGGAPFASASLAPNATVAFLGAHPGMTHYGLFQGGPGSLVRIADSSFQVPNVPGATFNQGFLGPSYDGGPVTFMGISSVAGTGIYASVGGALQTLVDRNTPIPGGTGNFSGVGDVFRSGSSVSFAGIQAGTFPGFYRWTSTGVNAIVTTSTPIPNGTGNFTTWGSQSLTGDRLAFSGRNDTTRGVYSRDGTGSNPISIIADTSTLVPGTTQLFAGFTVVSADGANTAFAGGPQNNGGVWAHIGGQLIKIVDRVTPGPSGEQFLVFDQVSMSGTSVAFLAQTTLGDRLYVWRNGDLSLVVKRGDVLNSIFVDSLDMTSQSLRGDTVAFSFSTPPGTPQEPRFGGVYTATFIPAPGAAALLLSAGLLASRRRRDSTAPAQTPPSPPPAPA